MGSFVAGEKGLATPFYTWVSRIVLLLPALVILFAAVPRLLDGIAVNAAFPTSAYIPANVRQSERAYRIAQLALAATPQSDGEAHLLSVEAGSYLNQPPSILIPQAEAGLANAPADARGWILLAQLLSNTAPAKAAAALRLAFDLAPYEYYQIGPRSLVAASLWQRLPAREQALLFANIRWISAQKPFQPVLMALLQTNGGTALIAHAFVGRPTELRALNRSIVAEQLGLSQ